MSASPNLARVTIARLGFGLIAAQVVAIIACWLLTRDLSPSRAILISAGAIILLTSIWLIIVVRLLRRDQRFREARVIHVHTLPDFLVAAAGPARRRGARVILDMLEIFPEFARTKFGGWLGRRAEPVARMVMVRQVSSTVTPSAFRGTGKCSTVGPSVGSS